MSEHIVVILKGSPAASRAREILMALPAAAVLEPLFTLPPQQTGEHEIVSEMRRTMRVTIPPQPATDVEELVQKLKADPLVENAYRERPAELA